MQVAESPTAEHPIDRYIAKRRAKNPAFGKEQLAEEVGCSRNAIYRVMSGDDAVSTGLLEKFETATDGELSAVELFAAWKAARGKPASTT